MDPQFEIETLTAGSGTLELRVRGEVDTATCDQIPAAVAAHDGDISECVIDVSGVTFMDSSGIRALLLVREQLGGEQAVVRLVGVPPHLERLLKITGLDEVFETGAVEQPVVDDDR